MAPWIDRPNWIDPLDIVATPKPTPGAGTPAPKPIGPATPGPAPLMFAGKGTAKTAFSTGGKPTLKLTCTTPTPCKGSLSVREDQEETRLAAASFTIKPGKSKTLTLTLTKAGKAALTPAPRRPPSDRRARDPRLRRAHDVLDHAERRRPSAQRADLPWRGPGGDHCRPCPAYSAAPAVDAASIKARPDLRNRPFSVGLVAACSPAPARALVLRARPVLLRACAREARSGAEGSISGTATYLGVGVDGFARLYPSGKGTRGWCRSTTVPSRSRVSSRNRYAVEIVPERGPARCRSSSVAR